MKFSSVLHFMFNFSNILWLIIIIIIMIYLCFILNLDIFNFFVNSATSTQKRHNKSYFTYYLLMYFIPDDGCSLSAYTYCYHIFIYHKKNIYLPEVLILPLSGQDLGGEVLLSLKVLPTAQRLEVGLLKVITVLTEISSDAGKC